MKILKYFLYAILIILLIAAIGIGSFIYKAKNGIEKYETTAHTFEKQPGDNAILVISKTNAFRHGEAIEASAPIYDKIAKQNNWSLYSTDDAGVFNEDQLQLFDLVVFNNCTGKILNPEQRTLFKNYINGGGGFLGVHGSGDASHQWGWYSDTLIGARFSHHPIKFHIQEGTLHKEMHPDSSHYFNSDLAQSFTTNDEWYVFYDSPRTKGVNILYTLDEAGLDWDGTLGPFFKEKTFGMGDDHPIVWYKDVGQGKSFYTAMGHDKAAWSSVDHHKILEAGMRWAGELD